MIILDTDSFTHFFYGKEAFTKRAEQALQTNPEEELTVTRITWFEAIKGRVESILKAENEENLKKAQAKLQATQEALEGFQVLPVDDEAAKHFEKLRQQKKLKMRRADMLIACIELAHNALLVTGNTKDFKGVAGLRLENWIS